MHSIIFGYLVMRNGIILKNRYQYPFLSINRKLHYMNQNPEDLIKDMNGISFVSEFIPHKFAKDVNELIERYYLLNTSTIQSSEVEIKQKVLDLVLIERHFLSSKTRTIGEENLYLNQLIKIVDEKYITSSLSNFLTQVTNYCCEFYHEISCKIIVLKKDQKDFSFKSSALSEAIFSIFTFIIRGNFDIYNEGIISVHDIKVNAA